MQKIVHYLKLIGNFGFYVGWCSFIYSVSAKLHIIWLQSFFMHKKDKAIISYLKESLNEELAEIEKTDRILASKDESNVHPKYIWVFWATDNVPDIVQSCLSSIKQFAEDMQLIVVNPHNFEKYVSLDPVICEKLSTGAISITHFTDIIRMKLLYEYGGVWLDCTMLQTMHWNKEWFEYPLFTHKIKDKIFVPSPSGGGISSFFWISKPNCTFFSSMYNLFVSYWRKHDMLIDYLLIDYSWVLIIDSSKMIKQLFDSIPYSNPNMYILTENINKLFTEDDFLKIVEDRNTCLYKLSYKKLASLPPSRIEGKYNLREVIINHYKE